MSRLNKKKIIITGGTSGIGKAIVEKFSCEGAMIVFCGRSEENGHLIEKDNKNTKFIQCDLSNENNIHHFFKEAIFYLDGLDAAINNAGISGDMYSFHETTHEMLMTVMNTNFFSVWNSMQNEIQYFISHNKTGSIINMSSTSGLIGNGLGLTPYSVSKHAIVGLTKSTALEYAKNNIRINALCPGFVDTPMTHRANELSVKLKRKIPLMHPLGRVATPNEIANAALFLCSDESTFTTGSCMVIDGGLTV